MRIELGVSIQCADGPCGTVGDVVITPSRRMVTHVVVDPHHDHHRARLVPIAAFDPEARGPALRLTCTKAAVQRYPEVEDTALLTLDEWPPLQDEHSDVGVSTVVALASNDMAPLDGAAYPVLPGQEGMYLSYDRIPAGEIELRRHSAVKAADGANLGHVGGFVVDGEGSISHLVLERRHLWGRRHVTIPVAAVKQLQTDVVTLQLTTDEVAALPAVAVRRHRGRTVA